MLQWMTNEVILKGCYYLKILTDYSFWNGSITLFINQFKNDYIQSLIFLFKIYNNTKYVKF